MATRVGKLGSGTSGTAEAEGTPLGRRVRSLTPWGGAAEEAGTDTDTDTETTGRPRRGLDDKLAIVAVVMIPAGVVAILLAWHGASQTPFVFEQIPYLISGGLLGIGLMAAGGLLYVGSWIARLTAQERDEAEKVREVIAGLRDDLAGVPALSVAAVEGIEELAGRANPTIFWATPTGSMFHRRDCQVVARRDDVIKVDQDDRDGLQPCRMCDPPG